MEKEDQFKLHGVVASNLALYKAVKYDEKIEDLKDNDDYIKDDKKNNIPPDLLPFLTINTKMKGGLQVKDYFNLPDDKKNGVVHVLVEVVVPPAGGVGKFIQDNTVE